MLVTWTKELKLKQVSADFYQPLSSIFWRDVLLSPVCQHNLIGFCCGWSPLCGDHVKINNKCWLLAVCAISNRGTTFRQTYLEIGTVRSLLPNDVRVMALTATATKVTRNAICEVLGMVSPAISAKIPNKRTSSTLYALRQNQRV